MTPLRDFIMAYGQTNLAYYDETPHGDSCMVCETEGVYTPRNAVERKIHYFRRIFRVVPGFLVEIIGKLTQSSE